MSTAAAEPHVPGPGRSLPTPKNVAIVDAHAGAGDFAAEGSEFTSVFVGIIRVDAVGYVLYRRRDHIFSAGPFAQIKQAAPFAAEREVLCAH